jgi:hypothetical protein
MINGLLRQRRHTANALKGHLLEPDITAEAQREIQAALKIESMARKTRPGV